MNIGYTFEAHQGLPDTYNEGTTLAKEACIDFFNDNTLYSDASSKILNYTFQGYGYGYDGDERRVQIGNSMSFTAWISPDMCDFLGRQCFGAQAHKMDGYNEPPLGGNMVPHREELNQIFAFETQLVCRCEGIKHQELFKGEEIDFFHRLAHNGWLFLYRPDILLSPNRLVKTFSLTLHKNLGILKTRYDTGLQRHTFIGSLLFIFRQHLWSPGHHLQQILAGEKSAFFENASTRPISPA